MNPAEINSHDRSRNNVLFPIKFLLFPTAVINKKLTERKEKARGNLLKQGADPEYNMQSGCLQSFAYLYDGFIDAVALIGAISSKENFVTSVFFTKAIGAAFGLAIVGIANGGIRPNIPPVK